MKPVGLALLALGGLIFVFGLVDLIGSFGEFDVWAKIGIELPAVIWQWSAYIELGIGGALLQQGRARLSDDDEKSEESEE